MKYVWCLLITACASGVDPRAAAFAAELVACVERSESRGESQECRHKVELKYGFDGGSK